MKCNIPLYLNYYQKNKKIQQPEIITLQKSIELT